MSLATHVSFFLRERLPLERRASERTCETYALALRLFFEFAAQRLKVRPSALTLEQLDAPLVLAFLTHLETQRHNSPTTRNVRLAAIRTFMRFIEYREPSAVAARFISPASSWGKSLGNAIAVSDRVTEWANVRRWGILRRQFRTAEVEIFAA